LVREKKRPCPYFSMLYKRNRKVSIWDVVSFYYINSSIEILLLYHNIQKTDKMISKIGEPF